MAEIQALNNQIHRQVKISPDASYRQSAGQHFAPLVVQEFIAASQDYPIVFIKNSDTGQFNAVALLGLKPQQNLFYQPQGWRGGYVPQNLALYPFMFSQEPGSDRGVLCLDFASHQVNEQQGEALFDAQGQQSVWLAERAQRVVKYVEQRHISENFIKLLLDLQLLQAQSLTIQLPAQDSYSLNGLYGIDEQRLNSLSDEEFLRLRSSGALPAIYAALLSMQRIDYLSKLASQA